jgi:hypothetical protein
METAFEFDPTVRSTRLFLTPYPIWRIPLRTRKQKVCGSSLAFRAAGFVPGDTFAVDENLQTVADGA